MALRNPHFPCLPNILMTTTWLSFPFAQDVAHSRAFFFDVGSTYFDSGVAGDADSLAWFLRSFQQRGIHFSHIYAWERGATNHDQYWQRVPDAFKHRMHFFNTAASDDVNSGMNPLRLMERVAHPKDYVVFKLDIDNNEVEVKLILQLLNNSNLTALVDEVFWENHVKYSPTQYHGWGDLSQLTGPCSTLSGSYGCFRQMRQAGIRAHSWI
eukprot:GGOE01000964.1.p1 GENE.GGOE01000964.1~~GGOE01000964.1.p1  ORF type:complete len:211 (+),score=35.27 GGOE01000964.1:117-749(+)